MGIANTAAVFPAAERDAWLLVDTPEVEGVTRYDQAEANRMTHSGCRRFFLESSS